MPDIVVLMRVGIKVVRTVSFLRMEEAFPFRGLEGRRLCNGFSTCVGGGLLRMPTMPTMQGGPVRLVLSRMESLVICRENCSVRLTEKSGFRTDREMVGLTEVSAVLAAFSKAKIVSTLTDVKSCMLSNSE